MDKIIPLRISHSSLQTFHSCPRKFQIEKFSPTELEREESEHFSFGHAIGAGVAVYMATQDEDKAIFATWLAYWPEVETEKKNISIAISAIIQAFPYMDQLLDEYEVVSWNGKPAAEFSIRIDISEFLYFVGHIDLVLYNKKEERYVVMEVKHTGLQIADLSPLYKNSGQALGYSLALDTITGQENAMFDVLYFVIRLHKDPYKFDVQILPFTKTTLDRLQWLMGLKMDEENIEKMHSLSFFPKNGDSCLKFNKPCYHFQLCDLYTPTKIPTLKEDTTAYDFTFSLDFLIEQHMKGIEHA